jgi:hypothetical protein
LVSWERWVHFKFKFKGNWIFHKPLRMFLFISSSLSARCCNFFSNSNWIGSILPNHSRSRKTKHLKPALVDAFSCLDSVILSSMFSKLNNERLSDERNSSGMRYDHRDCEIQVFETTPSINSRQGNSTVTNARWCSTSSASWAR